MILKLKSPNVTLKTKDKYCTEDIHIVANPDDIQPSSLKKLLDTTKSTYGMFYRYQGDNVDGLINYNDTENVESFNNMYAESNITHLPLLNISNVKDMSYMCSGCNSLTDFDYDYDTSKVTIMRRIFTKCKALQTITLNTDSNTDYEGMFNSCECVKKIDITYLGTPSNDTIYNFLYYNFYLKALIIRSFGAYYNLSVSSNSSLYKMFGQYNATYNPNTEQGYVYVPRDMIDTLSQSTNWSSLQFRALEDYTHDGTCWGEFDDAKAGL